MSEPRYARVIGLECSKCGLDLGIIVPGEENTRFYGCVLCSTCAGPIKAGLVIQLGPSYLEYDGRNPDLR